MIKLLRCLIWAGWLAGLCLPVSGLTNIPPGVLVWMQGYDLNPASPPFRNEGTLKLECIDDALHIQLQVVAPGMENAPGGRLLFREGAGGSRTFFGNLLNRGEVRVDYGTVFAGPETTVENEAEFLIFESARAQVLGPKARFVQRSGRLECGGGLEVHDGEFEFQGGTIVGEAQLIRSRLRIDTGLTNAFQAALLGADSVLEGALQPGQVVRIMGSAEYGPTSATFAGETLVGGRVELTSTNAATEAVLHAPDGLTVLPEGRVVAQAASGGGREIQGRLRLQGRMEVGAPLVLLLSDSLTNRGALALLGPRHQLRIESDFVQATSGRLEIELTTEASSGAATAVRVLGRAALGGALSLRLADGLTAIAGNRFDLLAANGLSGGFQTVELPVLPAGLHWDLRLEAGHLTALVSADAESLVLTAGLTAEGLPRIRTEGGPTTRLELERTTDFAVWEVVSSQLEVVDGGLWRVDTLPVPAAKTVFYRGRVRQ